MPPRWRNNARHRKGLPNTFSSLSSFFIRRTTCRVPLEVSVISWDSFCFLFFLSHLLFCAQEGDCSCQDGLSCVLSKKVIEHGIETPVKQCMPGDVDIEVESIDLNNQAADAPMRIKRWLFFNVSWNLAWTKTFGGALIRHEIFFASWIRDASPKKIAVTTDAALSISDVFQNSRNSSPAF